MSIHTYINSVFVEEMKAHLKGGDAVAIMNGKYHYLLVGVAEVYVVVIVSVGNSPEHPLRYICNMNDGVGLVECDENNIWRFDFPTLALRISGDVPINLTCLSQLLVLEVANGSLSIEGKPWIDYHHFITTNNGMDKVMPILEYVGGGKDVTRWLTSCDNGKKILICVPAGSLLEASATRTAAAP